MASAVVPDPLALEELERHDLHVPVHSRDADAVVADRPDRAGDVRAVAVVVHAGCCRRRRNPSRAVVDEAVAVVVDAVGGEFFAGVRPDVGGQVGVDVVDARVDHRDDDAALPRGDVPSFGRIDIGVRRAARLAGIVQVPERAEARVVGKGRLGAQQVVGLGIFDERTGPQGREGRGNRKAGAQVQFRQSRHQRGKGPAERSTAKQARQRSERAGLSPKTDQDAGGIVRSGIGGRGRRPAAGR